MLLSRVCGLDIQENSPAKPLLFSKGDGMTVTMAIRRCLQEVALLLRLMALLLMLLCGLTIHAGAASRRGARWRRPIAAAAACDLKGESKRDKLKGTNGAKFAVFR